MIARVSARTARPGLYISVDIEADGPIPGLYSMISFGAAVAGRQDGASYTAGAYATPAVGGVRTGRGAPAGPGQCTGTGSGEGAGARWAPKWLKARLSAMATTQPVLMPESRTTSRSFGNAW